MNLAARLSRHLHDLFALHHRLGGVSRDDYHAEPVYHPMADGKYLSAVATMTRCGLLPDHKTIRYAGPAIARLAGANVADQPGHGAWGLGFAWRGADAREPYVITTSVVAAGLLDIVELIDRDDHDLDDLRPAIELARDAAAWLIDAAPRTEVELDGDRFSVATFSPAIPELVTNVAAAWGAATARSLVRFDDLDAARAPAPDQIAAWIWSRFRDPVGWPYAADKPRYDLLHQCYIMNALLDLAADQAARRRIEDAAATVFALLRSDSGYLDKTTLAEREDALAAAARSPQVTLIPLGETWLIRHADPGRLWSLGELLVVFGRLLAVGERKDDWRTAGRRLGEGIRQPLGRISRRIGREAAPLRHVQHLAHGAATLLAALRQPDDFVSPARPTAQVHETT